MSDIVINTIPLLSRLTGVGNCIYHTAKALLDIDTHNRYSFYYSYFSRKLICPAYPKDERTAAPFSAMYAAKGLIDRNPAVRAVVRMCADSWHTLAARTRGFDLYYEPNYILLPMQTRRTVVTVHDLSWHSHPEWHPADRILYFAPRFFKRIDRADVITTDSEFMRNELLELTGMDESRIRVVQLGYDRSVLKRYPDDEIEHFRAAKNLPDNFILFVGSMEPRKNIDQLLEAYSILPTSVRREFKLVLVGFAGWHNTSTMKLINDMAGDVTSLGYLDNRELALAYNAATAFAYPSLYEGFGLPPLEAMACGCPVVCSSIPPLREVCSDAVLFVDEKSAESIADGLRNILVDNELRRSLRQRGFARAKRFGWDKTASKMLAIFEELL